MTDRQLNELRLNVSVDMKNVFLDRFLPASHLGWYRKQ